MSVIINKLVMALSSVAGFNCKIVRDNPFGLSVVEVSVSPETYREFDAVFCERMGCTGFEVAFITKDDRRLSEDVDRYIVPASLGVGQILNELTRPQYVIMDKMLATNHGLASICLALEDTGQWLEQLVVVLDDNLRAANSIECRPGAWCEACPNSCNEYLGVTNVKRAI